MNDNENGIIESDDLIPIDIPKEINTYDLPELSFETGDEKTQCFKTSRIARKKGRAVYKMYSVLCVVTFFLTLIFSASELIQFVMDDMGAHDILMKKIFGYGADEIDDKSSLFDLIISKTFVDLSLKKEEDLPVNPDTPSVPSPPIYDTPNFRDPSSSPSNKDESSSDSALPPPDAPNEIEPPMEEGLSSIISMDMSLLHYGKNYIYNDTSKNIDIEEFRSSILTDRYDEHSDAPLVLIIHTHTTESFMPDGATHYKNEGEIARSNDQNKNMIAVGVEFARALEENGIRAIHCTVVHDAESYRLSYQRSAETIAKYLAEYPSIQYVFDLHRDSIVRSSGELVRAVTSIDGKSCAQIMPVVSAGFEDFEENLSFAVKLRDSLNQSYVNLSRPICVRESTYNQDLAPISVLLEMGTSGNSLSEVNASAHLVAEAIANLIKQK